MPSERLGALQPDASEPESARRIDALVQDRPNSVARPRRLFTRAGYTSASSAHVAPHQSLPLKPLLPCALI